MVQSAAGPLRRLTPVYLLSLVVVTGSSVLVLEVLGTRVIGTHYGASLYVWAALLAVTLVCLAAGYAIGGWAADRRPRLGLLGLLVMAAGAAVLLVPRLSPVLAPLDRRLGLQLGAVASAYVIFALPLTLLAMAGPFVIRLLSRAVERVGSTSGAVYALSTVGSVGGVMAVSLWMIPVLGTRLSLAIVSAVLVGWGALGVALATRGRGAALVLLAAVPILVGSAPPPLRGELVRVESAYGDLRVVDRFVPGRGAYRMLLVDGIAQTGMPLDLHSVARRSILRSDRYYLELLPCFHADEGAGRRGVLIGLAGGMFSGVMEFYDIDWTAVEIDPRVVELAKAYFGYRGRVFDRRGRPYPMPLAADAAAPFPRASDGHTHALPGEYRGRAVIDDGRRYLADHPDTFDFIVVDAYSSDSIPFHLITREFFDLARRRLGEDGILALNYIGRPTGDLVTASLFRTLGEVFGRDRLRAWRTGDDETAVQVMLVVALKRPMDLLPLWQWDGVEPGVDRLSYELAERRVPTEPTGGVIITDDHNPVDFGRAAAALEWRRRTQEALRE